MSSAPSSLRRLWQPRNPLFWMVVVLQLLSGLIVLYIQLHEPPDSLRLLLGLMALSDSALAWWLTVRLWRTAPPPADAQPDSPLR